VPSKSLSCVLIGIVLNVRSFFICFLKTEVFFFNIPVLLKVFHTFRFNLCGNGCVYI